MSGASPRQVLSGAYRRFPEGLRRAILVKRRESLWVEKGIVFIHIPKAAGTSINLALYGRFMGHVRASDILNWGSARLRRLPRFAVIRNPWDRLVSAYRFARRGSGTGGMVAGMSNPQSYQIPEFESFDRFVNDWLAPRDIDKLDGVFRPQCSYVFDTAGRSLVEHLGKLEDLGPTYDFIESKIGKIRRFARTNRSGSDVDYRHFYTPQTVALVGNIYQADVKAFGYEF